MALLTGDETWPRKYMSLPLREFTCRATHTSRRSWVTETDRKIDMAPQILVRAVENIIVCMFNLIK